MEIEEIDEDVEELTQELSEIVQAFIEEDSDIGKVIKSLLKLSSIFCISAGINKYEFTSLAQSKFEEESSIRNSLNSELLN